MSRLIVVSNRVPLPEKDGKIPAGGLAVALHAALETYGGIWMGWSGKTISNHQNPELKIIENGKINYAVLDLNRTDIDEYYAGFANRMLWPLCHYRLDLIDYTRKDMAGYFRVNRLFAKQLQNLLQPDDIIWVHDYHLIPLAAELRQLGVENRIGFFMHIPWPSADVFFTLPVHEIIIRGLSSYDLVGFQTDYDVENFIGCLKREKIGQPVGNQIFDIDGHRLKVQKFGIGIETKKFAEIAAKSANNVTVKRMSESMLGRKLIIGVDRLDYSKGIPNRIEAFEEFIVQNPEQQNKVTFLQITPKSRSAVPEYIEMQSMVAELAGRVNGALAAVDWTPIRYITRSLNRNTLAGLYRQAQVGLVTPLRDGMNLVAKEYVAAQNPDNPGVLVLSRFAGAARELDGAILVNPYDKQSISIALRTALSMPFDERKERFQTMMDFLMDNDIHHWCRDYIEELKLRH
ncbi:alpha,alpha-trehalose-phosphate synthase (UDP-forming) [Paenochrobactrum sp. BZR 588]|uniref:alpha,alpha-trehalose-phosphate synthase (UDP-forming) n=1 Tax=Paenochrobactrum TaxID=999488 RepID=UPI0035BC1020